MTVILIGDREWRAQWPVPMLEWMGAVLEVLAWRTDAIQLPKRACQQARWLREAELKHCRVAMLATLGCIVQDVMKFPGVDTVYTGDLKLTKLHDAAVEQGTMGQMLVWLSFFEIFGTAATIQMLQVRRCDMKSGLEGGGAFVALACGVWAGGRADTPLLLS